MGEQRARAGRVVGRQRRRKRRFVGAERAGDGGRGVVRCERRRMREAAAAGRLGAGLDGVVARYKNSKTLKYFWGDPAGLLTRRTYVRLLPERREYMLDRFEHGASVTILPGESRSGGLCDDGRAMNSQGMGEKEHYRLRSRSQAKEVSDLVSTWMLRTTGVFV